MRIIEFTVGKKKLELVCGLIWHPLSSKGSAQATEIKAFAKNNNDDLKIVRLGETPHVGLAKKLDGAKEGQIALAALLADAMAEEKKPSCVIAIALPSDIDSFVFVAIRDSVILADSDFIGTRDEIKVRLTSDVAYGGWDCVICPEEWGVLNAKERTLLSFLSPLGLTRVRKRWQLKAVEIPWQKAVAAIALVAVVIAGSSYGWKKWKHKQYLAAEAIRIQQEQVELGLKNAANELPKPWPLIPTAPNFTAACEQAYERANLTAGNWTLEKVVCEGGNLTLRWAKTSVSAWPSHLHAARPDITIAEDGMSATLNTPITAEPSNDFTSALPSATGIRLGYQDIAGRMGVTLQIEAYKPAPAPTPLPGQAPLAKALVPQSWSALSMTIESTMAPLQVIVAMDQPGLRISKIEYPTKTGVPFYKLTGVQYVSN